MSRLIGGIHRGVSGRADEPLRFYLVVDRGLKTGKLDNVDLGERDLIRLIQDAAGALALIHNKRESE